ncbi:oocyte-secreted protein 3-like [Monodelphis domestica]|uniref:oocyte-secreted protein 3-like n=1 Tax=Monodelphis domestica TaxID=13616 RepID=UPI0024E262BC|nr:oocyte-secreted protein 3-like [Monodelphis domestica]
MKSLLVLGVLCLLVCLTWANDEPVTVECSLLMFRVSVKKNIFGAANLVTAEELMLGTGCQVNGEKPNIFELHYSVSECGIQIKTFETHAVYKVSLHYTPKNPTFGLVTREFSLACTVFKLQYFQKTENPDLFGPDKEDQEPIDIRNQASVPDPSCWRQALREIPWSKA